MDAPSSRSAGLVDDVLASQASPSVGDASALHSGPSVGHSDEGREREGVETRSALLERADSVLERLRNNRPSSPIDMYNSDLDLLNSNLSNSDLPTSEPAPRLRHIHVLSRAPPTPHVSVTSAEGERGYIRLREEGVGVRGRERKGLGLSCKQLLTVPFAELKATVEEEVCTWCVCV